MTVLAAVGFTDAAYLSIYHWLGKIPPCTVDGCEIVTTSKYSVVAGIPIAYLGALYYVSVFIALIMYFEKKNPQLLQYVLVATTLGALVSFGLIYLQIWVIHAICIYCMASATASISLAAIMWWHKCHTQSITNGL